MGKKIRAEMEAQRKIFVDGATARGIDPGEGRVEVFDLMAKFADYGFNKSHAAAYALVAYQTAWLKANHPEVFLAACMSLALSNTDRLASLKQEAERGGHPDPAARHQPLRRRFLGGADARTGALCIRYALAAVKKVGFAAMQALVAARGDAPFADLADFAARVDPRQLNKMQLENLARAGAFDSIDPNRARLFAAAETILRRAQATAAEAGSGQIGLFGGAGRPEPLRLPDVPDWPSLERLGFEAEAVGFHLTAHPLDAYRQALRRLRAVPIARLEARAQAGEGRVKLAGTVVAIKERITKTGNRMAFVRISDATGSCEVTLFSEVLAVARPLIAAGTNVLVSAELQTQGETMRITALDVAELDRAAAGVGAGLRVWLAETAAVPHIRTLLGGAGRRARTGVPGPAHRCRAQRGDRAAGRVHRDPGAGAGDGAAAGGGTGGGGLTAFPHLAATHNRPHTPL